MPWQQQVADVAGEWDLETGLPAYREIVVTVPRQSGKTALFLAFQLDRCLSWGSPQRSVFTAQSGKDARDKWLDELFPLIRRSKLAPLVQQINEGIGNESVKFKTGSLIRLLSTSASSGHSKTLHQAVLDEIWHDVDDRREQGLGPAMVTIPDAQTLVCSTAGTSASTVLNRKTRQGRERVSSGRTSGSAYFEWSAPDGWDPDDEESWYSFMPALGHTIGPEAVRAQRDSMEPQEFLRAYGNRATAAADQVIAADVWQRVCSDLVSPEDGLRFGVDVAQDRSSAAVVAFGGNGVFELVDYRSGTGWLPERVNQLTSAHGGRVAVDFGGPAGVLADQFESCDRLKGRDVLQACGGLFDAIVEGRVSFRRDRVFDDAVAGAVKKPVGDQWVWSRKSSSTDVTPLMAATVAFPESTHEEAVEPWVAFD